MTAVLEPSEAHRPDPSIEECYFYHSMTLPGHGEVQGEWDLRGREREYYGNVELAGRKVLEIGTASGHLCFWMEQQGADVLSYDLSPQQDWDIVPYHNYDFGDHIAGRKQHIRELNNAWWFAHKRFNSKARVAYGSVYDLSPALGKFDVVTMGAILLHLRDPFLAIQKAASLSTDTLIITDVLRLSQDQAVATVLGQGRIVRFMPDSQTRWPFETWWGLSPHFIAEVAQILGFTNIEFSVHRQRRRSGEEDFYTIVARRNPAGEARYNKATYNELILQDFDCDQYLLAHLSARGARILASNQELVAQIDEKAARIQQLETRLEELTGSRSWRLARRLAAVGRHLLPAGSGRRRAVGSGYRGVRALYRMQRPENQERAHEFRQSK